MLSRISRKSTWKKMRALMASLIEERSNEDLRGSGRENMSHGGAWKSAVRAKMYIVLKLVSMNLVGTNLPLTTSPEGMEVPSLYCEGPPSGMALIVPSTAHPCQ